jgi:hypothetical protein
MAKDISFNEELKQLQRYIESKENEDAKRQLLYPLFTKLFKDKFSIESGKNTHGADGYVEGQLIVEAKTNFPQWLEGFYQALHITRKNLDCLTIQLWLFPMSFVQFGKLKISQNLQ